MLNDKAFREQYRGKLAFQHADIPFGYFKNDAADIRWSKSLLTLVATASMDLATDDGTFVIKMGDRDAGKWRRAFQQAGWFVERDRVVLLQTVPWMKRKAYTTKGYDGVQACHHWMICHKKKRDFYLAPKAFGTRVFVCLY